MSTTALLIPSGWRVLGPVQALRGYAYGCRYPALRLTLQGQALTASMRGSLLGVLSACEVNLQPPALDRYPHDWPGSVGWLLSVWQALLLDLGQPVFEGGQVLTTLPNQALCVLPCASEVHGVLLPLIQVVLEGLDPQRGGFTDVLQSRLGHCVKALRDRRPTSSNLLLFVKTAFERGLPFRPLPGGIYQYGVGRRARWLDSTFTEWTPTIGVKLSRHKRWAADLLRQAGLPVPAHDLVGSADQAVAVARRLGYPVVVKPADLDGGVGVAAGLETEGEVRESFDAARKHSRQVLVEKHVEGRDYRITVFNGEAIWAIERVPAGVEGDGERSVAELVERVNADPRRGADKRSPLQRLPLDTEAHRLLLRQGLTLADVPAQGRFVRLRQAANVATGGMPVAVFERLHPDNARLAVRAAEALRLDMAGIDLLIPDIAVSWRTSGAAICEVNAQPQLGQTTSLHLYKAILQQQVPSSGRVPTFLVLGAEQPQRWLDALQQRLEAEGLMVGVACRDEVRVGAECLHSGVLTLHAAGSMLALDRRVDAMVLALEDDSVLQTGLPVDCVDAVIWAGRHVRTATIVAPHVLQRLWRQLLRCVLLACDGVIVTPAGRGDLTTAAAVAPQVTWHRLPGDEAALAAGAWQLLCDGGRRWDEVDGVTRLLPTPSTGNQRTVEGAAAALKQPIHSQDITNQPT